MWPFNRIVETAEAPEERSWVSFDDVFHGSPTAAGMNVTRSNAVQLPAVWRCITLNSETPASLPVDCLLKRGAAREPYAGAPEWLQNPNDEQTWPEFIQQFQASIEIDGNGFAVKASDARGRVVGLYCVNPTYVEVTRLHVTTGPIVYNVTHVDGSRRAYPFNAVVHVKGFTMPAELRGLSPIATHALTIGQAMAAGEFGARFFGEGANLSGVIEHPTNMNAEQTERLKSDFRKRHGGVSKSHAIGVLTGGAHWVPMTVKPEESQFLETQRYTASQIAYIYGLPPEYVTDMGTAGAKGYVTALAQRNRLWLQTGLLMRLRRLEVAFSALLDDPAAYIRFNVDGLLRADPAERAAMCTAMIQNRAMTPNEWRALEDMNPLPGGDEPLESVQFQGRQEPPDAEPDADLDDEPVDESAEEAT